MHGGGEWGGAAIDPTSNVLYVNSNEDSCQLKMSPYVRSTPGGNIYSMVCQNCHGFERQE